MENDTLSKEKKAKEKNTWTVDAEWAGAVWKAVLMHSAQLSELHAMAL